MPSEIMESTRKIVGILLLAFHIYMYGGVELAFAAAMSGSNYKIQIDSVNIGGARATSSSYRFENTVGEVGTGKITDSNFHLFGGFLLPSTAPTTPAQTQAAVNNVSGGGFVSSEILDVVVTSISTDTAVVSWRTNKLSNFEIIYGTSKEDEKVIKGEEFESSREVVLERLSPDTSYQFEIIAYTKDGQKVRSGMKTLKTLPFPISAKEPPANVSDLKAIGGDAQMTLTWKNPLDADLQGVRIVRSTEFYPSSPWQEDVLYEGTSESFGDTGLTNGVRYYYTVFAYDTDGNFASGAVVSGISQAFIPLEIPPLTPEPEPPSLVPSELVPPSLRNLGLEDFDFIQKGAKIPVIEGKVEVEPKEPLTIAIDYEKIPEVLKTILVALKDREGKSFSFLLRIDEEKTRYLASLMPPDSGDYGMTFTVVDYKNQGLQKVAGTLAVQFVKIVPSRAFEGGRFPWSYLLAFLLGLLVIGMVGLVALVLRRFLKEESKRALEPAKKPYLMKRRLS